MSEPIITRSCDIRLSTDGSALVLRVWPGAPPREMPRPVTKVDILSWLERGLPRSEVVVQKLLESLEVMVTTVPVRRRCPPIRWKRLTTQCRS